MRFLSAAAIKAKVKRGQQPHLQNEPGEGTRIRELYDLLKANPGLPIDLKLRSARKTESGKKSNTPDTRAVADLQDYYGLDIRCVQRGWHPTKRKTKKAPQPSLHVLAGEWFGPVYIDYIAQRLEEKKGGSDGTKA